jgi:hypothetical protein
MRTLPLALAVLLLGPCAASRADTVVLAGGSRLEGVVLEKGEAGTRLLLPEGSEVTLAAADVKEVLPDAGAPAPGTYMRWHSSKVGPSGLQVALVHFVSPDGKRRVDLVSAVHIADAAFFREVTKVLELEDVVLYEMVKAEGADPEAAPEEENPIRKVQAKMAGWLGLAFQLDHVDYGRPHFQHADMTLEEFEAAGGTVPGGKAAPGGGVLGPLGNLESQMEMLGTMMRTLGVEDPDPAKAAEAKARLRTMIGRMVGTLGSSLSMLLGGPMNDVLIVKRNEVVVEKLKALPPEARRVAVFYGAGHFQDLEKRLADLGWRRAGGRWLTAWAAK